MTNTKKSEDIVPTNEEERTHPTEEILQALAQINAQSIPSLTASQDTVLNDPNDSSQEAQAPPETPPSEWDSLRAQLASSEAEKERLSQVARSAAETKVAQTTTTTSVAASKDSAPDAGRPRASRNRPQKS